MNPSYYNLGDHTETTEVVYDPSQTSYARMLEMFWKNHDSTARCTRQYMSAIFYNNEEQKKLAEDSMKAAQSSKIKKIQTVIVPATTFYDAEDYHQKYLLQQHPFIMNELDLDPGPELIKSHVAARLNGYVGGYGKLKDFEEELPRLKLSDKVADYVRRVMAKGSRVAC